MQCISVCLTKFVPKTNKILGEMWLRRSWTLTCCVVCFSLLCEAQLLKTLCSYIIPGELNFHFWGTSALRWLICSGSETWMQHVTSLRRPPTAAAEGRNLSFTPLHSQTLVWESRNFPLTLYQSIWLLLALECRGDTGGGCITFCPSSITCRMFLVGRSNLTQSVLFCLQQIEIFTTSSTISDK